ncbi:MAG: hypothetical protein CMK32_09555 [Porticoccaceae bacterium]|nr:hypothetical protein [Porticoccaceae bacterium]
MVKIARILLIGYLVAAVTTTVFLLVVSYRADADMGFFEAVTYGMSWPVTWLLGLIFWLAAENR